jgi:hypothetical protein
MEATKFSPFSAAEIPSSPPLRSSLRWRERKGTPDSRAWRVDRCRLGSLGGGALVVAAAARTIKVPEFQPNLGVVCCDVEELVGFRFPGAVGVAAAATGLGIFVLSLLPRFGGGCSVAIEGTWRCLYRSFLLLRLPGVRLIWSGSAVVGRRFLLWSRLEVATTRLRRLGDVSPPMVYQRLRFRRSRWMTTAVFQRSLAAIELRSALGVWWTRLLLLRPSSGGAADLQRRVAWWPGVRTFKDHFVFFLSARVLSALSPGQLAFGLLLACGCVCGLCSCI